MAKGTRVTIIKTVLDSIRKALPENERNAVLGLAEAVEDEYRKTAPRDTGSMAESVYTKTKSGVYQHGDKTTEAAVEAKAKSLNPDAEIHPLPTPPEKSVAYVAPIVGHFPHNEYGTTKMAARPTLQRARNKVRSELDNKHRALFYRVVTNGHR